MSVEYGLRKDATGRVTRAMLPADKILICNLNFSGNTHFGIKKNQMDVKLCPVCKAVMPKGNFYSAGGIPNNRNICGKCDDAGRIERRKKKKLFDNCETDGNTLDIKVECDIENRKKHLKNDKKKLHQKKTGNTLPI